LHLRPTLIDGLLQADEAIVTAAQCEGRDNDNEKQNDEHGSATDHRFVHKVLNRSGNAPPSQSRS